MNFTRHQLNMMKLKDLRRFARSEYGLKVSAKPKWVIIEMIISIQQNPDKDVENVWYKPHHN